MCLVASDPPWTLRPSDDGDQAVRSFAESNARIQHWPPVRRIGFVLLNAVGTFVASFVWLTVRGRSGAWVWVASIGAAIVVAIIRGGWACGAPVFKPAMAASDRQRVWALVLGWAAGLIGGAGLVFILGFLVASQ